MTALAIVPRNNTKSKTDAGEFLREAHEFCRALGYGDAVFAFDNWRPMPERRAAVLQALDPIPSHSLDTLALFCHGWHDGVQAGFTTRDIPALAGPLSVKASFAHLTVVLYCCSTAADGDGSELDERLPGPGGDGGFADRLRDALNDCGARATVFAHSVPGHTTRNPWVRVFRPEERAGGHWLVEPRGPLWSRWLRALRDSDLRFKFPFVSAEQFELLLTGVA